MLAFGKGEFSETATSRSAGSARVVKLSGVQRKSEAHLQYKILLARGIDSTDRIATLATFVIQRGGCIVDFRYFSMGTVFGASLHVAAAKQHMRHIASDAERSALFVICPGSREAPVPHVRRGLRDTRHTVQVTAMDHPALIADTCRIIASHGIRVAYAEGVSYAEPLNNQPYFTIKMLIDVPHEQVARLEEVRNALDRSGCNRGYRVHGPAPEIELAYSAPINWAEDRRERYYLA